MPRALLARRLSVRNFHRRYVFWLPRGLWFLYSMTGSERINVHAIAKPLICEWRGRRRCPLCSRVCRFGWAAGVVIARGAANRRFFCLITGKVRREVW